MSGSLMILPAPPQPAVWDLAREDAHPELGMRPGAVLGVDHGLGQRRRHRGTALVVVQAFRDLTDEAVARGPWRGAGHVDLGAVDEHPGELARLLIGRVNSLVL